MAALGSARGGGLRRGLNVLLEESGFFELTSSAVLSRTGSPVQLLIGLTILSAVLSALFLNDTVCLMLTVPVLAILRRSGLPNLPYLVALAMSANIGSVMTVVGNPQNMLIGNYSGWTYAGFFLWMAPVGVASVAALVMILLVFYGSRLRAAAGTMRAKASQGDAQPQLDRELLIKSLVVFSGMLLAFVLIGDLPLVAIGGAMILLVISRRSPAQILGQVNWVLLAFFAGLFIVVRGLEQTGLVKDLADAVQPMYGSTLATQVPVFGAVTVVASNVVSNVPFVVLARQIVPTLIEPQLMWLVLAMASTLAGNLTIPGSVATLIVLETARQHRSGRETSVGFFEFLRVGIPVTLVTTTLGTSILVAEHWLFGSSH
ncbi:MAG: anion transporter [Planctomycetia bacterium]|nr:anion transporter [Planctomycetia bacterium]